MEPFINRLKEIFATQFQDGELVLEPFATDRIGGYMAWAGFEGVSHIDRQKTVWDYLYSAVPKEDLRKVSSILTLTPRERDVYRENATEDDF